MKAGPEGYLGLAKRAGKLVSGYNTCIMALQKRQAKLVILTEDVSENTEKKFQSVCRAKNIPLRKYGSAEELSNLTGNRDKGIFAVTDSGLSDVILKEIDNESTCIG